MDTNVEHIGKVIEVNNSTVIVSFSDEVACSSCSLSNLCKPQKKEKNSIAITTSEASSYELGEKVKVIGNVTMQKRAIFFGTALPCIILIASIFVANYYGCRQALSALIGIAILGIYYIVLYIKKDALKKKFNFIIKKL
ncbi:MAG: SoxR reducing system RseC family protein [Muribaculaceae bacterium]